MFPLLSLSLSRKVNFYHCCEKRARSYFLLAMGKVHSAESRMVGKEFENVTLCGFPKMERVLLRDDKDDTAKKALKKKTDCPFLASLSIGQVKVWSQRHFCGGSFCFSQKFLLSYIFLMANEVAKRGTRRGR